MDNKTPSPPQKKSGFSEDQSEEMINIIRQDAEQQGMNPDETLQRLGTAVKDPNVKLVKIRKTVFMLKQVQPGVVEVHMFNGDSIPNMVQNFEGVIKTLKNYQMKQAYTYTDNPTFKQLVERSGYPVQTTQTVKPIRGEMKPVYLFTLDL